MKLIKLEKCNEPIWYFTSPYKVGKFIKTNPANIYRVLKGGIKQCKGWFIEEVEIDDANVNKQYVNPGESDESTMNELLNKLNETVKLLKSTEKRIEALEKQIYK